MNIAKIYYEIAKQKEITIKEARKEIKDALDQSYQNPNRSIRVRQLQDKVPRKKEIPTPEEFLEFIIKEMIKILEQEK